MPELPQLAPFDINEFYSNFSPDVPVPKGDRPNTLLRKLISAGCTHNLILSVTAHSSWP